MYFVFEVLETTSQITCKKYEDIKSSSFINQCIRTTVSMPYTQATNHAIPFHKVFAESNSAALLAFHYYSYWLHDHCFYWDTPRTIVPITTKRTGSSPMALLCEESPTGTSYSPASLSQQSASVFHFLLTSASAHSRHVGAFHPGTSGL